MSGPDTPIENLEVQDEHEMPIEYMDGKKDPLSPLKL
jgi:hypothetical protein